VIEVFPHPETVGKVMYLVASEMNERYKRRLLRYWDRINGKLQSIRMVKYGNKALVDAFCLTQNSVAVKRKCHPVLLVWSCYYLQLHEKSYKASNSSDKSKDGSRAP
jgi:hypothetical protein